MPSRARSACRLGPPRGGPSSTSRPRTPGCASPSSSAREPNEV